MRPPFLERMHRIVQVVKDGDKGVVVVLKAASRSMINSGLRIVPAKKTDELPSELHVFVRDPIDRLKSAFQFFKGRPPIMGRHQWGAKQMSTWEGFVDGVLDGITNPHWRSVSDTMKLFPPGTKFIVHAFENINDEWPLRGKLERRNQSKPIEGVDMSYRADELRRFYKDDYKLREQAGRA